MARRMPPKGPGGTPAPDRKVVPMKSGDPIEVSAAHWRGSSKEDRSHKGIIIHRTEGITLRIGPSSFGDPRLEIEMSFEEWGKVVAGLGGAGTIERIR